MINYYLLTKPGIILGNLATFTAGFLLASGGKIDFFLFLAALLGLTFVMASACIFNNYFDKEIDRKMQRTHERPFVKGSVSETTALGFATILGVLGSFILFMYTNLLTLCIALFGFLMYVVIYTLWKSRTVYGTAIGSLAGAVPPVVGYCTIKNQLDAGAFILFALMVFWQMPHFFAIAIRCLDDYAAAKIPVLPLEKGIFRTKIHMTLYVTLFILTAASLSFFGYTGYIYLGIIVTIGMIWLGLSLQGFLLELNDKKENFLKNSTENHHLWATKMYRWSLITIGIFCVAISF